MKIKKKDSNSMKRCRGPVDPADLFERLINAGGVPPVDDLEDEQGSSKRRLYASIESEGGATEPKSSEAQSGQEHREKAQPATTSGSLRLPADEKDGDTANNPATSKSSANSLCVHDALKRLARLVKHDNKLVLACNVLTKLIDEHSMEQDEGLFLECLHSCVGAHMKRIAMDKFSKALCHLLRRVVATQSWSSTKTFQQIGVMRLRCSIIFELCEGSEESNFCHGCEAVAAEVLRVLPECARDGTLPEQPWQEVVVKALGAAYDRSQGDCFLPVWNLFKAVAGGLRASSWLSKEVRRELERWLSTLRARHVS